MSHQKEIDLILSRLQKNKSMTQAVEPDLDQILQEISKKTKSMHRQAQESIQQLKMILPQANASQLSKINFLLDRIQDRQMKLAHTSSSTPFRYIKLCQNYFSLIMKLELLVDKIKETSKA